LSLTHLENGGWTIADLHHLTVYELEEDNGSLINAALTGLAYDPASTVLKAAVDSGMLIGTELDISDGSSVSPCTDTDSKETQP
jgi:hypothetical protein